MNNIQTVHLATDETLGVEYCVLGFQSLQDGEAASVTVNDRGCFGCRAVFACHDPSVRFRSCVFLCGEVCVDKGIFGEPILILACKLPLEL